MSEIICDGSCLTEKDKEDLTWKCENCGKLELHDQYKCKQCGDWWY